MHLAPEGHQTVAGGETTGVMAFCKIRPGGAGEVLNHHRNPLAHLRCAGVWGHGNRWFHHRLFSFVPPGRMGDAPGGKRMLDGGGTAGFGSSERRDQWDRCAGGFAIDEEIAVGGDDGGIVMDFREACDAGIGEVHGCVGVFGQQLTNPWKLTAQVLHEKTTVDHEINDPCARNIIARGEVAGLGEDGFADDSLAVNLGESFVGPFVVAVSWAEPSDKWTGIEDDLPHFPKPSMWALLVDRSVYLPLPIPQRCCRRSAQEVSSAAASDSTAFTMVSSARALAGRVSVPQGRTTPFSNSTSTVNKLMGGTIPGEHEKARRFGGAAGLRVCGAGGSSREFTA